MLCQGKTSHIFIHLLLPHLSLLQKVACNLLQLATEKKTLHKIQVFRLMLLLLKC